MPMAEPRFRFVCDVPAECGKVHRLTEVDGALIFSCEGGVFLLRRGSTQLKPLRPGEIVPLPISPAAVGQP